MMKDVTFTVIENRPLTRDVYQMRLEGDVSAITAPGQFVNVKLDGLYLRRPLSVCDVSENENRLTLLYKTVGKGTAQMAALPVGARLTALTGLGNGFDPAPAGERPLLIGGGVGVPPLVLLAKRLLADGRTVSAVLGFNTKEDVFYADVFRALGCDVTVTTVDGGCGVKGVVTDALPAGYTYFYTCGPERMLKAVYAATVTAGQFSFEERMGCGFGACMGCSCRTLTGAKRICKDGPVLKKEEILWQTPV